ncbi:MAG: hypothetical protein GX815_09835 [Clostridiales bacterium]|nr:hypothetical protein [Clostridiales bacterium]
MDKNTYRKQRQRRRADFVAFDMTENVTSVTGDRNQSETVGLSRVIKDFRSDIMSGLRFLYISREGEVYPIPIPKDSTYKKVTELANELVLKVNLIYETRNRKPWQLYYVGFDRVQLNALGQYIMTDEEIDNSVFNFTNFSLVTAEELSKREDPLPVPQSIDVPTAKEKEVLINYIKHKYPALWQNSPSVIEETIRSRIEKHTKLVKLVKEASAIRRKENEKKD